MRTNIKNINLKSLRKIREVNMIVAIILIATEIGTEHNVEEKIKKEEIKEILVTYGSWDIVVRIEVDDLKKLDPIITNIRKIKGIVRTETLISA